MKDDVENRQRVLVVDDDASVCRLLEQALEAEGYAAESCLHPEEALALCRTRSFGLVFVDIRLPGMSGFDLASRIKEDDPEREVVFITGFGSFDSVLRAIKIGAYDYLRKPFNLSELNLCLRRYQERRELKGRIRSAERRYRDLVRNIPMMIWVLGKDLTLEFVNEACEPLLGFAPEEAGAEPGWFLDRVHPADRAKVRRLLLSAFEPRSAPFSTQCRLLDRKGRQIHVLLKSLPQEEPSAGVRERLEGVVVDITDRVVLERAMVQREKLKTLGAVSAEVAHEIRNPLVSIGGFARRLQEKQPDLVEGEIILEESRRLEGILDRIRDYLKPVDVDPRPCNLNDVIRSAMEYMAHDFERCEADFVLELDENLPVIRTDPDVLAEVLTSLARNAIEAMDRGGTLAIRSAESDRNVAVILQGRVPPNRFKNPESLLLPFEEAERTHGLPLCYRMLRNVGGLLSCDREGEELVFTVSLPKPEDSEAPAEGGTRAPG